VRAQVVHHVAVLLQHADEVLLEVEPGMIRANRDP